MQRKIKFRAWNKLNNQMWSFEELQKNVNQTGDSFAFMVIAGQKKEFIPMQFTGLKDKNGKEIYEGDICVLDKTVKQYLGHKPDRTETEAIKLCPKIEIKWGVASFNLRPHNETGAYLIVIGNIYQGVDKAFAQ